MMKLAAGRRWWRRVRWRYAGRVVSRSVVEDHVVARSITGSNVDAFRRHRGDAPTLASSGLVDALDDLPASDDPAVTFASLARRCVPSFADMCGVELSDGTGPRFRLVFPEHRPVEDPFSPAAPRDAPGGTGPDRAAINQGASAGNILHTPFRAPSRAGYPPYAGVLMHQWISRTPTDSDALAADLMARHAIALVDRERLMTALGQSDDRAAQLALEAISGRTISLATGIVMHQGALSQDAAEEELRLAAEQAGSNLYAVATQVVLAGALADLTAAPPTEPRPVTPLADRSPRPARPQTRRVR